MKSDMELQRSLFFMKLSVNLVLYETQSRAESNANFPKKNLKDADLNKS